VNKLHDSTKGDLCLKIEMKCTNKTVSHNIMLMSVVLEVINLD